LRGFRAFAKFDDYSIYVAITTMKHLITNNVH